MQRSIVLANDPIREVFATQAGSGECGVFWVISGPRIQAGDMLDGDLIRKGHCQFLHPDGVCLATGETGPVVRAEALRIVQMRY